MINHTDMYLRKPESILNAAILSVIRNEQLNVDPRFLNQSTVAGLRSLLGDLLISSNHNWKEATLELIDKVLEEETDAIPSISVDELETFATVGGTDIVLWQGDITQLKGSDLAIVNAANDLGLGCFVPNHKCIDNVIHRRAGPRLRIECHKEMTLRGHPLSAGTDPIVTGAYHLPSNYVIHVTGPHIHDGTIVREEDRIKLSKAYDLSLNAAKRIGAQSIAFPCISTGLYGFPPEEASRIAVVTVSKWLKVNPNTLKRVVFNVFTSTDKELYDKTIQSHFVNPLVSPETTQGRIDRSVTISLAKQWIDDADAILVCAGAGMSIKDGEMVYTNPHDFAKAYPWFTKWGYKTCYETMGLEGDQSVPRTAKWALYAKHMDNMRWKFTPNEGYTDLLKLIGRKDHFVLTSNVDGCFERSGFDPSRIYTPQGEWTYVQCKRPCHHDSVFFSWPYVNDIVPRISNDGFIPEDLVPKCPRCGEDMFGNVRGGSWFLHHKYEQQNTAMQQWMQKQLDGGSNVLILEIGAGFNTPTVTRFPVESFARELGGRGRFIRINPTEADVPDDLNAIALKEGWQVLGDLVQSPGLVSGTNYTDIEKQVREMLAESNLLVPDQVTLQYRRYIGHFDWRNFLSQLGNNRTKCV
jgi:O-acetyl-ADP-ribose deacetylase (regulator of RNase III)/NAD-dependent SIR2 family protein deacetylase